MARPVLINGLMRPQENQAAPWTANRVSKQQLLLAEILH